MSQKMSQPSTVPDSPIVVFRGNELGLFTVSLKGKKGGTLNEFPVWGWTGPPFSIIQEWVKSDPPVEALNLWEISIDSHGFEPLIRGIRDMPHLKELRFFGVNLADGDVDALVAALENKRKLRALAIVQTGIHFPKAVKIAKLIGPVGAAFMENGENTARDKKTGFTIYISGNKYLTDEDEGALSWFIKDKNKDDLNEYIAYRDARERRRLGAQYQDPAPVTVEYNENARSIDVVGVKDRNGPLTVFGLSLIHI